MLTHLVATGLAAALASGTAPLVSDAQPATPDPRPLFRVVAPAINEVSGIAADPDGKDFYVHEDASGAPQVYVLDLTGATRATVNLPYPNEDWEDIGLGTDEAGRPALFLADTGDAYFTRKDAKLPPRTRYAVIRLPKPDLAKAGPTIDVSKSAAKRYPYVFADRQTHNAETLLVQPRTNRVYVVDKNEKTSGTAYLWQGSATPSTTETNEFSRLSQVPVMGASGGAFSPSGDRFAIRDATTAYVWRVADGDVDGALKQRPVVVRLPAQPQGEGVSFTPDGRSLVIGSERTHSLVWEVPLPPDALPAAPGRSDVSRQVVTSDGSQQKVVLVAATAGLALAGLLTAYLVGVVRRRRLA